MYIVYRIGISPLGLPGNTTFDPGTFLSESCVPPELENGWSHGEGDESYWIGKYNCQVKQEERT